MCEKPGENNSTGQVLEQRNFAGRETHGEGSRYMCKLKAKTQPSSPIYTAERKPTTEIDTRQLSQQEIGARLLADEYVRGTRPRNRIAGASSTLSLRHFPLSCRLGNHLNTAAGGAHHKLAQAP